jgi:hypothetical protein
MIFDLAMRLVICNSKNRMLCDYSMDLCGCTIQNYPKTLYKVDEIANFGINVV